MAFVVHKKHRLGRFKTLKMFEFSGIFAQDPEGVMRAKITFFMLIGLFSLAISPAFAAQEPGYFTQMGQALSRGTKNIVSFPWEIPSTIGRYDQKNDGSVRAFRDAAGFVDGTFRAVTRLCCGLWDVVFSVVPGQQDELPLTPKTLF
jgi:hypothetical protein